MRKIMKKELIAKELLRIAKEILSIEFATKQQLNKYLKEHPEADPKKHSVKENKKVQKKQTKEITSPEFHKEVEGLRKNISERANELEKTENLSSLKDGLNNAAGRLDNLSRNLYNNQHLEKSNEEIERQQYQKLKDSYEETYQLLNDYADAIEFKKQVTKLKKKYK